MRTSRLVEVSRSFPAMNTSVKVLVCVTEEQITEAKQSLNLVQTLFFDVERRLSRFRPESELSRLNESGGQEFTASPWLYGVVAAAVNSARLTGGIFDPAILPYLSASGYDRSFELLAQTLQPFSVACPEPGHSWKQIRLNPLNRSITLSGGCTLDLGGIAKGWTVDQAGKYLKEFRNYAVDAGGDIMVGGRQADGQAWTAGIADPLNRKPNLCVVKLSGGAICTSTIVKRKWLLNGIPRHHLIDPRTALPADSGVISATVIARSAVLAETFSKAALILGLPEGLQLIEKQPGIQGLLVMRNGSWKVTGDFPECY